MNPSSTSCIRSDRVLGGALTFVLGCSSGSTSQTDVDSGADDEPWEPCGDVTMTDLDPEATESIVIDGWTVAEILARINDVELDFEWTYWDSEYFTSVEPPPQTLLQLRPILASAVIRGYDLEIDDEFCKDRIDVTLDIEVSSGDGVFDGASSANVTFWISDDRTSLHLSTAAKDLGFETMWPLEDERQPPSEVVLRIEAEATGLGLVSSSTGTVWLHWVWLTNNAGMLERWEEYFEIATVG